MVRAADRSVLERVDPDVARHAREIGDEFRMGFEAVDRIDRPAATIFGSAASLGLGALQIGGGLEATGLVRDVGNGVLIPMIIVLTAAFVLSAVSGIESIPYWLWMSGFTKRQPSVVSSIFIPRENAADGLPMTKGARDILSTPPASNNDASPALMARPAIATASRLEPQRRLIVVAGTVTGKLASSAAILATFLLSSPAWFAQP